ncbi:MAG: MvaI/BcnI family restriction endonuclease [Candidatus Bathyarchaeia archaeon]
MPSSDRIYTKEQFIDRLRKIKEKGWIPSGRSIHNVGAVGNTLEDLLGIKENNLPIANAGAWELKSQRSGTSSLTTLFHFEPWPRQAKIVPRILLPKYGWPHQTEANEMSFRVTMSGNKYTDRGFKVVVDRTKEQVQIDFDSNQVDSSHKDWLKGVEHKVGLGKIDPEPYWPFDKLKAKTRPKLKSSFYLLAKTQIIEGKEQFLYESCLMLEEFNFDNFLAGIDNGFVLVDFDAKTTHNHGTKFRMKQDMWPELYDIVERVF